MISRSRPAPAGAFSSNRSWYVLAALVAVIALMAGGSRSDLASVPLFRAVTILLGAFVLATTPASAWREARGPLILLGLLALWMIIQLVPLPPAFWSSLPLRGTIFEIDKLLGEGGRWRPISLTPSMTVNSLMALAVPAVALLAAIATPAGEKLRIWWLIWAFGVASSLFGLLQLATGARSLFYLYRITNEGAIVGLFANRNHFAVLLSLAILAAGWLISHELLRRNERMILVALLTGSILMFLLLILAIGSRLGLICGFAGTATALIVARWRFAKRPAPLNQPGRHGAKAANASRRGIGMLLSLLPVVVLAGIAALFYLSDRVNAVSRLVEGSGGPEMRVAALGTVSELVRTQWLVGTGFGSFARVFQIVEPDALLRPTYLNQAHNDWLQWPIEGGLPAILIVLAMICGIVWRLVSIFRARRVSGDAALTEGLFLAVAFACIAFASLVDYPLRTPSLAVVATLLVVMLLRCGSGRRDEAASVD